MIYAYMWIQMNSKLITTSHKHYFLKLVVNIYFPVNVIKSRIRGEDRRGDIGHCPASALCSLNRFCAHAAEVLWTTFCALVSLASTRFYVCKFREEVMPFLTLYTFASFSAQPKQLLLPLKKKHKITNLDIDYHGTGQSSKALRSAQLKSIQDWGLLGKPFPQQVALRKNKTWTDKCL